MLAWMLVVLSGLGLFLSSWIVIPAPTFSLLPLGVGAPEVSPLLLLGNGVLLAVAGLSRSGMARLIPLGLSVCAVILSSLPLLQLPAALRQADQQMQTALGADYATQIPAAQVARMRPRPLVWADLVTGLANPPVQPLRQSFQAADGTALALEIYPSDTPGLHPGIVAIYGGGWQSGEPSRNARFHRYMANQGYTVVAIDYRHAPQHQFPAQLQDVELALQWVRQNAASYSIDTNRVALVGWSAGAHLALLAAYQTRVLPVRAVVSYYGPTNLTEGYQNPPVPDPIRTRPLLEALMGGSPSQLPEAYAQASPVNQVRSGLPPSLLIYGSRDHLVKFSFGQQLYDRLQATGNTAVLIALPWSEHAFDAIFNGLGNQIALYHTERFLAWALQPPITRQTDLSAPDSP